MISRTVGIAWNMSLRHRKSRVSCFALAHYSDMYSLLTTICYRLLSFPCCFFPWLGRGVGGKGVNSKLHSLLLFLYLLASERAKSYTLTSFHKQSHHLQLINYMLIKRICDRFRNQTQFT